jgi:hypothetical protein
MDLSTEHGLTPILRLATVYDHDQGLWVAPEADPDGRYHTVAEQYASFVATLAWPSEAHYVIVGNEPNHGNEWGGRPDPAAYARFLIDVADALHEADPQARVLNAGLDLFVLHTGDQPFADGFYYLDIESFMDAMIAAEPEVFGHIDAWASHPYPLGPFRAPPWDQEYRFDAINDAVPDHVRPPSGIVNRGINGYEWELWKLSTYGIRDLPVVITETGWRHREAISPSLDGGEDYPDAATVAVYFDLALRGNDGSYPDMRRDGWLPWLSDPRVIAVTPFALDGAPGEWGHTNWLQIEADGAVLGTYALFDLLAAYPDG